MLIAGDAPASASASASAAALTAASVAFNDAFQLKFSGKTLLSALSNYDYVAFVFHFTVR